MARIIAVLDNGSGCTGQACDDCSTPLRYEYHTDDGGLYGSECVHRHIEHRDGLTLNGARDAEIARACARQYDAVIASGRKAFECRLHGDGSGAIGGITRYGQPGARLVINRLIADGWQLEQLPVSPLLASSGWRPSYVIKRT